MKLTITCSHANGAIIGSAFIRALEGSGSLKEKIDRFVRVVRCKDNLLACLYCGA